VTRLDGVDRGGGVSPRFPARAVVTAERADAYAVFPTVGEAGFIIGGARGKGHVYVHDTRVGDTTMSQLSAGFQAGGKAYSQIIFFEDKRALDEFESGSFEFAAGVSAVAVTPGASASAGTTGSTPGPAGAPAGS
jgi:lipid-binding SYLF domain-containing protein